MSEAPAPLVASARPLVVLSCLRTVPQFGDKFRKARETKNLSLDDVSRVTKIGTRMLQAIEEEHFDLLPGGVFNKGFIRAYAKQLGLNDEEAVNDYLACLRQAQIEANQVRESDTPASRSALSRSPRSVPPKTAPQSPSVVDEEIELPDLQLPRPEHVRPPARSYPAHRTSGIPWMTLLLALIVILLAALLWTRHSRPNRSQAAVPSPAPTGTIPQSAPAASTTITQPSTQPTPQPSKTPSTSNTATNKSIPNSPSQPAPHSATSTPSPDSPTSTSASQLDSKSSAIKPLEIAPPTAEMSDSAKPPAPLTLVIRATENTWISVLADGQLVSQETLIAPAHTRIRAAREITVKVGNAAGVSFLWNNEEVPAQGAEAEVKTLVFDATGMRVASTTTPPAQNP